MDGTHDLTDSEGEEDDDEDRDSDFHVDSAAESSDSEEKKEEDEDHDSEFDNFDLYSTQTNPSIRETCESPALRSSKQTRLKQTRPKQTRPKQTRPKKTRTTKKRPANHGFLDDCSSSGSSEEHDQSEAMDEASLERETEAGHDARDEAFTESESGANDCEKSSSGEPGHSASLEKTFSGSGDEEGRNFEGWKELVTARATEARNLGTMRSPYMVTCEFSQDRQAWVLRWKKPYVQDSPVKSYLVRVCDDLGIKRESTVKANHTMVKMRWLKQDRSYQAEVTAQYEGGVEETSLAVPIQEAGKSKREIPTYRDSRTGREFITVPHMGKLYEVFAAKEVWLMFDALMFSYWFTNYCQSLFNGIWP